MVHRPLIFVLAALSVTAFAVPVSAQEAVAPCQLCDPAASVGKDKPATPVSLNVEATLDFDRLILAGGGDGSAELGADGSHRTAGSVSAMGARAMVGRIVIRGEPGRYVRISLPGQILLEGIAGGIIRLDSIRSDLSSAPRLGSDGTLSFRFGGILRISGDVDGQFRGEIPIDVDYF